jgi:hypothetical protein
MVGQFKMRHQFAVTKQAGPHASAKRHGQLDSFAFNRGESLHVGVVQQMNRFAEFRFERFGQVESLPNVVPELRRGQDFVVPNVAGEPD